MSAMKQVFQSVTFSRSVKRASAFTSMVTELSATCNKHMPDHLRISNLTDSGLTSRFNQTHRSITAAIEAVKLCQLIIRAAPNPKLLPSEITLLCNAINKTVRRRYLQKNTLKASTEAWVNARESNLHRYGNSIWMLDTRHDIHLSNKNVHIARWWGGGLKDAQLAELKQLVASQTQKRVEGRSHTPLRRGKTTTFDLVLSIFDLSKQQWMKINKMDVNMILAAQESWQFAHQVGFRCLINAYFRGLGQAVPVGYQNSKLQASYTVLHTHDLGQFILYRRTSITVSCCQKQESRVGLSPTAVKLHRELIRKDGKGGCGGAQGMALYPRSLLLVLLEQEFLDIGYRGKRGQLSQDVERVLICQLLFPSPPAALSVRTGLVYEGGKEGSLKELDDVLHASALTITRNNETSSSHSLWQVTRQVYPVWTYSSVVLLVPVLLLTDYLRYKPVIILQRLTYVTTFLLVLVGSGVHSAQLAFFSDSIAMAADVSLFVLYF
ncbi:hypothetical protein PAMA_000982 [Pampus argenteus]